MNLVLLLQQVMDYSFTPCLAQISWLLCLWCCQQGSFKVPFGGQTM